MKEYFRWPIIIKLFLAPITGYLGCTFFLAVLALIVLKIVAHIFQTPFLKYEYYTHLIPFLLILIFPVYHLFYILTEWYAQRRDFTESEHILILLVIAIYSSMIFGTLNYWLYRSDQSSFSVDENVAKSEYKKVLLSQQQRVDASKRLAETSEKLVLELTKLERTSFTKSRYSYWFSNPQRYIFDTNIEGVSIYLVEETIGSETPITYWTVEVDAWQQKLIIDPDAQLGPYGIIKPFMNDTITRDDLVKAFQHQADWERNNIISPLEDQVKRAQELGDGAFSLPMTLFLYQAAMDAVGASPGYFNPASFLTRLMAFLYAFLKYIYFAVFVSVIAKSFAYPTAKATD
jgi:hypothetical protein